MTEDTLDSSFNKCLAKSCMANASSCCCKGQIFLPSNEVEAIREWLRTRSEAEQAEFERCLDENHDGFALFDQETRCQFLDAANLCRLHNEGVKPTECYWWPLHVYDNERQQLEIRISESCCGAHHCLDGSRAEESEAELDKIEARARTIGLDVIRRFREAYRGSYSSRKLRTIAE
jgi:hypothetical protein